MKRKIIFDTDLGGDIDDGGALAIIHQAVNKGCAELLACTSSTTNPYSVPAIDAINEYYGHKVEVGTTKLVPEGETINRKEYLKNCDTWYGKYVNDNYHHTYTKDNARDAVKVLREVLSNNISSNINDRVTIIVVGTFINIEGLLKSKGDEYSPLNGMDLVKNSVKEFSVMGCYFPSEELPDVWFGDYHMEAENNIVQDIRSAKYTFENSPVPIVVSHYTVGMKTITGESISIEDDSNPVSASYRKYFNGLRQSWDPISAYYAIYGLSNVLTLSKPLTISIDDRGISTYKENKSGTHYLLYAKSYEELKNELNKKMVKSIF